MDFLEGWMHLVLILFGTCVALIVCYDLRRKFKTICAHRRIEARFQKVWDGTKTNELLAWLKVKRILERAKAPAIYMQAVRKRIDICRARHWHNRRVKLPNGRVIVISTLN